MTPRGGHGAAGLVGLWLVVALPAAAPAQTPSLSLQATPSPFGAGATIAITASAARTGAYTCPYEVPPLVGCATLGMQASVQVTGSNGSSQYASAANDQVTLQTTEPGPGQTLQPVTYTLTGTVIVTYCVWDLFHSECYWPPEDYVETGQVQVTVPPLAVPSLSGVAPPAATAGSVVTLTGAHFGGSGTVTVNGVAASVSQWTSTHITATVPGGATSGPVVVTSGGQASNSVAFYVLPYLASVAPGSGAVGRSRSRARASAPRRAAAPSGSTGWRPTCRSGRARASRRRCRPGRRPGWWR